MGFPHGESPMGVPPMENCFCEFEIISEDFKTLLLIPRDAPGQAGPGRAMPGPDHTYLNILDARERVARI